MKMTIVYGIATAALGAVLAIGLSTHAQAAAPGNYSREPARKLSRPIASWRKRFTKWPVVRLDAPFAGHTAATTTEPRRSWPARAAGRKTTVGCIKWLQALACSRALKHPSSTSSMTPFGKHEAPG